jgi:hypothetical protein
VTGPLAIAGHHWRPGVVPELVGACRAASEVRVMPDRWGCEALRQIDADHATRQAKVDSTARGYDKEPERLPRPRVVVYVTGHVTGLDGEAHAAVNTWADDAVSLGLSGPEAVAQAVRGMLLGYRRGDGGKAWRQGERVALLWVATDGRDAGVAAVVEAARALGVPVVGPGQRRAA